MSRAEKSTTRPRFRAFTTILLTSTLMSAASGVFAQSVRSQTVAEDALTAGGRLVGTWEFEVTFRNCDTGDAVAPPFVSLHTYLPGGSALEQGSRVGPPPTTSRTVGQGVWGRTGPGVFQSEVAFFAFDANGQVLARVEIEEEIEFEGRDRVFSFGVGKILNPQGQQIAANCFTSPGERVTLSD